MKQNIHLSKMGKVFAAIYLAVVILAGIFDFSTLIIYQTQYPPLIQSISSFLSGITLFPLNYLIPVSPILQGLALIPFFIYILEVILYFILGSILGWLYGKMKHK